MHAICVLFAVIETSVHAWPVVEVWEFGAEPNMRPPGALSPTGETI